MYTDITSKLPEVVDLGVMPYRRAWALQHNIFDAMVEAKRLSATRKTHDRGINVVDNGDSIRGKILLTEHPSVITLGLHGDEHNLLADSDMLLRRGIEVIRIERGGDITYHGPGQLVAYPIIDMERFGLGVKSYVNLLEESVIRTVAQFGVEAVRVDGATGVWVDAGKTTERKICAIGVKCSRFVTMHGLALNVSTDLSAFNAINPCGFTDRGVTSLCRETHGDVSMSEVKTVLADNMLALLAERL